VSRFVARREFFGALVFDTETGRYSPFDDEAVTYFRSGTLPPAGDAEERDALDAFVASCRALGLVDAQGRFVPRWAESTPRAGYLSAPLKVSLNVTSRCNLHCAHCYLGASSSTTTTLSHARIVALLDEMVRCGVGLLSIKGGEPFVHPEILAILEAATQRRLRVSIVTNGTCIRPRLAQVLGETSVAYLSVSLDAPDSEGNDAIRGAGSFAQAVAGIRTLKRYFPRPVYLNFTLNRRNVDDIPAMFRLGRELESDGLRFRPILPVRRATDTQGLLLDGPVYRRAVREIMALADATGLGAEVMEADVAAPGATNPHFYLTPGCAAGNSYLHVAASGLAYPCEYLEMPEFLVGDAMGVPLHELWEESPMLREFRTLPANATCDACALWMACKGGCRARPILHELPRSAPDPWCAGGSTSSEPRS